MVDAQVFSTIVAALSPRRGLACSSFRLRGVSRVIPLPPPPKGDERTESLRDALRNEGSINKSYAEELDTLLAVREGTKHAHIWAYLIVPPRPWKLRYKKTQTHLAHTPSVHFLTNTCKNNKHDGTHTECSTTSQTHAHVHIKQCDE